MFIIVSTNCGYQKENNSDVELSLSGPISIGTTKEGQSYTRKLVKIAY